MKRWFQFRKARGEGQGVGGDRQSDGGTDVCVCPECGAEIEHDRGTSCASQQCPKCDASMVGKADSVHKPYAETADLPAAVRKLPDHGQEIYLAAFNAAYKEYDGDESKAHATAWAAVKNKYEQVDGKWVAKAEFQKVFAEALGVANLEGTYEARLRAVSEAVGKQREVFGITEDWGAYPVATTEASVIVEAKDRYWLVPYVMENGEAVLAIAQKQEVEIASAVVPVRQTDTPKGPWLRVVGKADDKGHLPVVWSVPIRKVDEERRLVYGIVLEPGDPQHVDAQQDFVKADEIELSAHDFMKRYGKQRAAMGLQHEEEAAVDIVESYIAPANFVLGGESVRKGSWVLATYVRDEDMWQGVKAGELTGYSIGGEGERVEVV